MNIDGEDGQPASAAACRQPGSPERALDLVARVRDLVRETRVVDEVAEVVLATLGVAERRARPAARRSTRAR